MKLTEQWYQNTLSRLQAEIQKTDYDALLLLDPFNLYYLTGFYHQSTERHLGLMVPREGKPVYYVPKLELEMAQATIVKDVKYYFDYPGLKHGLLWMLDDLTAYKKIGIDRVLNGRDWDIIKEAYPDLELTDIVYQMRMRKTPEEVAILKKAGEYVSVMVDETGNAAAAGESELSVHDIARGKGSRQMYDEFGDRVITKSSNQGSAYGTVLYGEKSAFPDAMMTSDSRLGDHETVTANYYINFMTYEAECSGTFVKGTPSEETAKIWNCLNKAAEKGIEQIKPGVRCCDVYQAYAESLKKDGLDGMLRYRFGHGKGLEKAEAPFLEEGDQTQLEPGMVLVITPGIYLRGKMGIRFSEMVVVTDNGCEFLTRRDSSLSGSLI